MDRDDPITQFFPGEDSVDLYAVLSVKEDTSADDIKKAYRRLALLYHPDKYSNADEKAKADASTRFLQVGFAYAVLSDENRRRRYDNTGMTDEALDLSAGEDGWEAYFEAMFDRVTRGKLDEMKKQYQGSAEEIVDIKNAYLDTGGLITEIMTRIPHSTHEDESRFVILISDLITKGDLPALHAWESSIKDEKARLVRKKQGEKEAKEAERLAKELGVWDEFYGSGKVGDRKSKGRDGRQNNDQDENDTSALQALILQKRRNMDSFFDSLADKYSETGSKSKAKAKDRKGKKRNMAGEDDEESEQQSPKKTRGVVLPDIDDEEFEKLQQKLFSHRPNSAANTSSSKTKGGRGRKVK